MKIEKDKKVEWFISNNIPFVLFREPGKQARIIIQTDAIQREVEIEITKKGFYAFPFSGRERSKPVYFAPDFDIRLDELQNTNIGLEKLDSPNHKRQILYEVEKEEYISDLYSMLESFTSQGIRKAIYSRVRECELDDGFNVEDFFRSLSEKYPKAFTYAMNIPGDGLWVGASPELLLSYHGGEAKTVALAGTLKIDGSLSAPEWTRKEIDEHRLVEKYIIALCGEMGLEYKKSVVRTSSTGKVYHLKSDFQLSVPAAEVRSFLERLHPTPAISGLPQDKAMEVIYETEKHERSYYCGFLGYVEDPEQFNLFINLRCMKLDEGRAYLFAGGGITPESDVDKEWEETKIKMATLTDLLQKDVYDEEISSVSC